MQLYYTDARGIAYILITISKCSHLTLCRQKEWLRIKQVIQAHMDFRSSRLPPGTYANTVNAANAALANHKAIAERNIASRNKSRPGTSSGASGDANAATAAIAAVPEPVALANPNLQDGMYSHFSCLVMLAVTVTFTRNDAKTF